jgi:hypothetical protein
MQHVSDETMLLDTATATFFGLDPVGTRMLDLAVELTDVAAVADRMAAEFHVAVEIVTRDLDRLLDELATHGLIERTDRPPPIRDAQSGGSAPGAPA